MRLRTGTATLQRAGTARLRRAGVVGAGLLEAGTVALARRVSPARACRPPSRTNRTRRVPRPVLNGHAASLTPY